MQRAATTFAIVLVAAIAVAPGIATPGAATLAAVGGTEHAYLMNRAASTLSVEVHYSDGVATTKFAFVQLAGANGGPAERLKPTPECTEWIGTFTEAAAMLGSGDNVANSTVRIRFDGAHVPLNAPESFVNRSLDLEIVSSAPGGLVGSILTCDQASGGLLRIRLNPVTSFGQPIPAVVRVKTEA